MPGENNNGAADDTSNSGEGNEGSDDSNDEGVTPLAGSDLDSIADEIIAEEESDDDESNDDDSADDDNSSDDESGDDESGEDDDSDEGDDDASDEDDDSGDDDSEEDDSSKDDKDSKEETDEEDIDFDNVDHFEIKEDLDFGIKPITLDEKFSKKPDVKELHDTIVNNALQAMKNVVGLANKQQAITTKRTEAQNQAVAASMRQQIDSVVKVGGIPAYKNLKNGLIDPNSEGGKVIAEVFDYMDKENADLPDSEQIKSFKAAYRLWKADDTVKKNKIEKSNKIKTKSKKGSMIGGASRGKAGGGSGGGKTFTPSKGMSLDDIET